MALILDGTNGLSDVDGTAAAPAIRGTDTNTGIFFPAADTIAFSEGGVEAMRIDSSGNVGIGNNNPIEKLDVVSSTTSSKAVFTNTQQSLYFGVDNNVGQIYGAGAYPLLIYTSGLERMRINADGQLRTTVTGTTVMDDYGCRAWVNFNGTANTNLTGTYSQTGTTVTVTITGHGYITGQLAFLDFTTGTAVDGLYTVTVTDANTFTVTQASRTTSGNVTSVRSSIRGSGNVSSVTDNGTGLYTINFITAMPDANYSLSGSSAWDATIPNAAGTIGPSVNGTYTASAVRITTGQGTGTAFDTTLAMVQVFR
jgi:hypothetical protein